MRLRENFTLLNSLGKISFCISFLKNEFSNNCLYVAYNLTDHAVYLTFSSRLNFAGRECLAIESCDLGFIKAGFKPSLESSSKTGLHF